jgi:glycosyltransferase involved in cell wall biosynthesis
MPLFRSICADLIQQEILASERTGTPLHKEGVHCTLRTPFRISGRVSLKARFRHHNSTHPFNELAGEAMLCARPVIATDIAGHREIIEDGVTGFLANAPAAASISVALERS